jgi:hypothetical protein
MAAVRNFEVVPDKLNSRQAIYERMKTSLQFRKKKVLFFSFRGCVECVRSAFDFDPQRRNICRRVRRISINDVVQTRSWSCKLQRLYILSWGFTSKPRHLSRQQTAQPCTRSLLETRHRTHYLHSEGCNFDSLVILYGRIPAEVMDGRMRWEHIKKGTGSVFRPGFWVEREEKWGELQQEIKECGCSWILGGWRCNWGPAKTHTHLISVEWTKSTLHSAENGQNQKTGAVTTSEAVWPIRRHYPDIILQGTILTLYYKAPSWHYITRHHPDIILQGTILTLYYKAPSWHYITRHYPDIILQDTILTYYKALSWHYKTPSWHYITRHNPDISLEKLSNTMINSSLYSRQ